MTRLKIELKTVVSVVLTLLLFISGAVWQNARALAASASPDRAAVAGQDRFASLPPDLPPRQALDRPATLSPTLSYYFISGNTFVADEGPVTYADRLGCRWQMTRIVAFTAPVHLPQASKVVSMTLYTYNPVTTTNSSQASFALNNGQGFEYGPLYVASAPYNSVYQQWDSTGGSPTTIDNQAYSYFVLWNETGTDPANIGLCGVRLAYYAPGSAAFLPAIER